VLHNQCKGLAQVVQRFCTISVSFPFLSFFSFRFVKNTGFILLFQHFRLTLRPMNQQQDIEAAVKVLRNGGVILYPTDTVWGIGCDATNAEAVAKVYAIKQRDDSKAMICLVDSDVRLQRYVRNVPEVAWDLLELSTKPTTVILDNAVNLAPNLIAADGSIAMRITQEPFSKQLCYRFQKPLVSTSANISGEPAAQNFCDISEQLLNAVDYVCWSRRQEHKPHTPSSIIKLTHDGVVTIIRK
jgi:L-threonylcarbamoyladenylate synthase